MRAKAPQLMLGYLDSSLDADAFDDEGFFRTGDLGMLNERGMLTITGRLKDVIIRKGENVSAKEVEDHLYRHPKVADVAVIGLPDAERGEMVCAVVQTAEGAEPITLPELFDVPQGRGADGAEDPRAARDRRRDPPQPDRQDPQERPAQDLQHLSRLERPVGSAPWTSRSWSRRGSTTPTRADAADRLALLAVPDRRRARPSTRWSSRPATAT